MSTKNVLVNLKAAFAGAFLHPASLFWFVGAALIAPIALLSLGGHQPNKLPWYFWAFVLTLVVVVTSVGIWRFARKCPGAEDISISPDRR